MNTSVKKRVRGLSALFVVIAMVLMSTASATADDWPNSRGDAANTGRSAEILALPLTERWHSSAPVVEENGAVVSNGIVYMSSNDGQLYAFDATGAPVTGFPVATGPNFGAPAVDAVNAKVYVLASGVLHAFNLDGTSSWTAAVGATGSNFNVGPIVDGGFVYLKADSTLKKYDAAGGLQWSVPSAGDNTQPTIMGGDIYVNTNAGAIRKYDKATGAEATTGGFPINTAVSEAGLAAANGRIFHKADQLYAYDASTGAVVWSAASGGDSTFYDSPAVSNGVVYVYGWDSKAYAFDAATGATMAGFPSVDLATPSDRNYSSPAVAGGLVFIGAGTSQKLKVLGAAGTASSGVVLEEHLTFSADTQGFDVISPVVSDGVVYAMLDGGGLYAFFASGATWTGGGITINGGAACTESQAVTLTIDAGSNPNVAEMRISEDPLFTLAAFEPVASSKAFTLSAGFGTKTVYIQFKDTSEQLSNVFNDQVDFSLSCSEPRMLSVGITGSGSVVSSPAGIDCPGTCSAEFADGAPVELTPTPAEGFVFTGWTGACTGSGACTVTMTADQSVTATFTAVAVTQTLSVGITGSGTVVSSPAGIDCPGTCSAEFADGAPVELTPTPAEGFVFTGWTGACTGSGACTVTMTADQSVTATFTAVAAGDLTVTEASEPPTVTAGENVLQTFTVTNTGETELTGVVLDVTFPAGATVVSSAPSQGSCAPGPATLSCSLGAIPGGASVTIPVVVTVPAGFPPGLFAASATVSSDQSGTDAFDELPGSQVVAPGGGQAFGFVEPGGTITTGNATRAFPTAATFTLPNTGTGSVISLTTEPTTPTYCGGQPCRGRLLTLSPFSGRYDDPKKPPVLDISLDRSVVRRFGPAFRVWSQKEDLTLAPQLVPDCKSLRSHGKYWWHFKWWNFKHGQKIAVPSPCVSKRYIDRNGDSHTRILILQGDPKFGRR